MQPLHFVANCISSTTVHQYFIFLIIVIFALIHHYNNEIIMKTELNFQDADTFYDQLLNAHEGLSAEQSEQLNLRLILLLANQVGDATVLRDCIESAKN